MKRLHGFGLIFAEFDDNNRRIYLSRHDTPVVGGTTAVSPQDDSSIFLIKEVNKTTKPSFEEKIIEAYKNYPLKKGKTVGVRKLVKQIRTEESLNQLLLAIKNYAAECRDKEPQYIKHFSTFAGCWQDYIEVSESKASSKYVAMEFVDGKLVPVSQD